MIKTPRRWLRRVALTALLSALAAGMGFGFTPRSQQVEWKTAAVQRGDVERTVTCLGSLQPRDYVDVGAQVSGQLQEVLVEIGEEVEKGQLIASIEASTYEDAVEQDRAEIASLEAQLAQKQAELRLARLEHERNAELRGVGAVSQSEMDASESALSVAEAEIAALRAQVRKARSSLSASLTNLEYTKIYAPMSGTVIDQEALEGETLNANQSAPVILRIADIDTMTVEAEVTEADVVLLRPGTAAYFTTLGLPDRRWQGEVRQILPTPVTENDVVLYQVLVDVPNADGVLMTDMTAQVFFVLDKAEDALLVPVEALRSGGGETWINVLEGREVKRHDVRLGVRGRTVAEVVSGLHEGQLVLLDDPGDAAQEARRDETPAPPGMTGPSL